MPNGTYGGVRGRKTKVGRKLSFSSYSIIRIIFRLAVFDCTLCGSQTCDRNAER